MLVQHRFNQEYQAPSDILTFSELYTVTEMSACDLLKRVTTFSGLIKRYVRVVRADPLSSVKNISEQEGSEQCAACRILKDCFMHPVCFLL